MLEIRFHGRGGQGAVTAAELLAQAVVAENRYAQAFPSFGAERRGAPVTAYLRVSEKPIRLREKIDKPDAVVILDPTLLGSIDVCHGLKQGGTIVLNCGGRDRKEFAHLAERYQVAIGDATKIALETLGVPIVNTAILGVLIRGISFVENKSVEESVRVRFGALAKKNIRAIKLAEEATILIGASEISVKQKVSQVELPCQSETIDIDALCSWSELELGCDIVNAGSTSAFHTGSWRSSGRPSTDYKKCSKCGLCWSLCPDVAYQPNEKGYFTLDLSYCKGCGICIAECPKHAITMLEE